MERFFKKEYDCHFYLSKRGIPIGMPTLFAQYTHKTLQAIERVTTQSSLTGDIKHQLVTKEIGEQTAYQVCNRLGLFLDYINDYNGNPFVSLDVHTALPDEVINEYLNEYLVGERGKSLDAVEKHKTALEAYYNWLFVLQIPLCWYTVLIYSFEVCMSAIYLGDASVWPKRQIPLYCDPVKAGFPSPAQVL